MSETPDRQPTVPYIPAEQNLPELTAKALILGILLAAPLGAANAYLALKAGLTVAAVFPAAVVSIAFFRIFKGSILEENIARTMASVGEALVAGAAFTIPAFVVAEVDGEKLWAGFNYWQSSFMLLGGGLLGLFYVIILRRALCVEADLPFPEAKACAELVKAGQSGAGQAHFLFKGLGIGMLLKILTDSGGLALFKEAKAFFIKLPESIVHHLGFKENVAADVIHRGGFGFSTPLASPALLGIGFIIGARVGAILFSGAVLGWLVLVPLLVFMDPDLPTRVGMSAADVDWEGVSLTAWLKLVRPFAIGAMVVGAFSTLYNMRESLMQAARGAFNIAGTDKNKTETRLDKDLPTHYSMLAIAIFTIPMAILYYVFAQDALGAIMAALVMTAAGFFLSAIGSYLIGLVGTTNQPLSGLTLVALMFAALVMVACGVGGAGGVAATLAVAVVVSCAICTSGDIIQDLKVGHILGGTPWKMEVAEIISIVVVSFFLIVPIMLLHEGNLAAGGIGIGDPALPAPQAGLMAQLANGIVGGEMPWGMLLFGAFFAFGLILMGAPSPMLIAVGMYLPFETSFAVFFGGCLKWFADKKLGKSNPDASTKEKVTNIGILIASGFIAGEALTGVLLSGMAFFELPSFTQMIFGVKELALYQNFGGVLSLTIFGVIIYGLVIVPLKNRQP